VETPVLALEPGAAARLDVTVDTRGKFGEIRKAVFLHSNDPVEPVKAVTLRLFVAHGDHVSAAVGRQSIFEGSCRRCHMDPGQGRYGEALYEASCAMCHPSADAGRSPGVPRQALQHRPASEMRSAIRNGIEGTSMAAFHKTNGGPLDDSQIDSVVRYLLGESSATLAAALGPDGPGGRRARTLLDSQ
jgi:cytochrome c553